MAYGKSMRARRRGYSSPFGLRDVIRGGVKAYQIYKKVSGSKTKTNSKKKFADYGGVSTQHDIKTQYVKKRMPKYKRKRWQSFVKKVRAVEIADRGLQTVVMNSSITKTGNAGQQEWHEAHLYSWNGNGYSGVSDIWHSMILNLDAIQEDANTGATTSPVTKNIANVWKGDAEILAQSATLDITWRNDSESSVEADIYIVEYKKGHYSNGDNFVGMINNGFGLTDPGYVISSNIQSGAGLSRLQRGVTLFDMSRMISKFGIRIIKKEKVFIPAGGQYTKQIRDPKNHRIKPFGDQVVDGNYLKYEGLTKSVISCWKNTDGSPIVVTQRTTRDYKYTIEGLKDVKGKYISGV